MPKEKMDDASYHSQSTVATADSLPYEGASDKIEYGQKHGIRVSYKLNPSKRTQNTESRLHMLLNADEETEEERRKHILINKSIIKTRKLPDIKASRNRDPSRPVKKGIFQQPQRKNLERMDVAFIEQAAKRRGSRGVASPYTVAPQVERLLKQRIDVDLDAYDLKQAFRLVDVKDSGPSLLSTMSESNIPKPRSILSQRVDAEIKAKHAEAEARLNEEIKRNALSTALTMDKRPGRWQEEYTKKMAIAQRMSEAEAKRKAERKHKANMAGLAIDFSWLHNSVKTDTEVKLKKWDDANWQRNTHCEVCWSSVAPGRNRLVCGSCNVVCHAQCADSKEGVMTKCGECYFCQECLREAKKIERKRKEAALNAVTKDNYRQSALMLKYVMRLRARITNRRHFKKTVIRFQAWIRGRKQRRVFRRQFGQIPRLYHIKVVSVWGLQNLKKDRESSLGVIVTINSEESRLEHIEDLSFVNEKQLFRYDTENLPSTSVRKHKGGVFDQQFFIPGTTPHVQLVATVVTRDDVDLKLAFHGQGIVQMHDCLFWNKPREFKVPLDYLEISPKEQASNTPIWIANSADEGRGELTVEVRPYSLYRAKCGHVEVINTANGLFRQKRWFCLVDSVLNIYSRPFEMKPRHTIYVFGGTVSWLEKLVINIKLPNTISSKQSLTEISFIPTDPKEKRRWFNLLKQATTIKNPRTLPRKKSLLRQDTHMSSISSKSRGGKSQR